MKTKQIFWGVFLITIGALILLRNYLDLDFEWGDIWKLWPLVIVLIGVNLMIKNNAIKSIISAAAALLLAFALYASVTSIFGWFRNEADIHFDDRDYDYEVSNYSADYSKDIKTAALSVEAGAGSFTVYDTTSLLFDAQVEGRSNNYSLTTKTENTDADLVFKMKSTKLFHKNKNRVEMKLNSAPAWKLNFDIGAAAVDFDFSRYDIENLDIQMGAASLKLKLGDRNNETRVNIDAGASSIEIEIPEEAGCEINADVSLSSKNFEGFKKIDEKIYRTNNFTDAAKKIYIDLESGISSIRVSRNNW